MLFIKSRYIFFSILIFILAIQSVCASEVNVSTSSELLNALNNNNYDSIVLNDGAYQVNNVSIGRSVSIEAKSNSTSISGYNNLIFNINSNGSLSLNKLTIRNTNTQGSGSSSPIISSGNLSISECIFSSNNGVSGGVITISDGLTSIKNSVFTGNGASANGGVINQNGGALEITGSIFTSNTATRLGGVINSQGSVSISDSSFNGNVAPVGGVLSSRGSSSISSSSFNGNNANTSGGAVYSTGDLSIKDSSFTSNKASYGGAVSIANEEGKSTNITNSIFTSNSANTRLIVSNDSYGGTGGAIYSEGLVDIKYSKFLSNSALYDGGAISIYGDGRATVNYNSFKDNTGRTPSTISADIISNVNLDFNWWGANSLSSSLIGSYNYSTDSYQYHSPDNWLILTLSLPSSMNINSQASVVSALELKSLNGGVSDFTGTIPVSVLSLSCTGGSVSPSSSSISNTVTGTYISPSVTGVYTVSASLDNEVVSVPVVVQPTIITTLYDTSISPTSFTTGSGDEITVNILSSPLTVNTGRVRFTVDNKTSIVNVSNGFATVNLGLSYGVYNVLAEYLGVDPFKNSSTTLIVNIPSPDDNTILSMGDLTKVYLGPENLTGSLFTIYGEAVIGQHLSLTLTRLSNGMSKTYDIVTDYTGTFSLPINLATGEYSASVVFNGFQNLTSASNSSNIHVLAYIDNRTSTWFSAEDYTKEYSVSGNFTGSLLSDASALIGQHVSLTLTRLSSGASKTYDSVTDYTGLFSLSINLAPGFYSVLCSFDGNDEYQPTSKLCNITVI